MSFGGPLIYTGNFHFHSYGHFILHKFSNTHGRTYGNLENSLIEVGRAHLKIIIIFIIIIITTVIITIIIFIITMIINIVFNIIIITIIVLIFIR